jgi:concentrative nucleoside transporter, CNT family
MYKLQAIAGIVVIFSTVTLLSRNRQNIPWKDVALGLIAQLVIAFTLTHSETAQEIFQHLTHGVDALKRASMEGTKFVFGYLGGGPAPFTVPNHLCGNQFIFAFQVLPVIIVFSALSMLLFHLKVIPFIVNKIAFVMRRTLNIGGAMGVVAASKLFLSQLETPLLVRPYLKNFSSPELFMVITLGMSTTAAAAMPLYACILGATIDHALSHIMMASLVSVPGAITLCRIYMPHIGEPTSGTLFTPYHFQNAMDAVAKGTTDGLQIFLSILAMLISFAAIVALVNILLGNIPFGTEPLTLQLILGWFMAPLCWLMGVPWEEAKLAGGLLGTKTILNEVFAFTELSKVSEQLSEHSRLIMTYALCGFANLSSAGMVIGALGAIVPERREEIVRMVMHAVLIGTFVTCLSGTLMGLFHP